MTAKPKAPGPQAEIVLQALEANTITPIEAFTEFGITRLAARIKELRDAGYHITTETVKSVNRLGSKCNYAKYRLVAGTSAVKA